MIPLGLALIALDVPPLRRRLRAWLHRKAYPRQRDHTQTGNRGDRE